MKRYLISWEFKGNYTTGSYSANSMYILEKPFTNLHYVNAETEEQAVEKLLTHLGNTLFTTVFPEITTYVIPEI